MRRNGEFSFLPWADPRVALRRLSKIGGALALTVLATVALFTVGMAHASESNTVAPIKVPGFAAQTVAAPLATAKAVAPPPAVSYLQGQLTIDTRDTTLGEVLTRVAAAMDVKIEIPADANSKRLSVVKSGPGSPREVLASLLRDSHLSYLIQASDTDPEKIQSVLIMPADVKGSTAGESEPPAPPSRGAYARTVEPASKPEEPAALVTPLSGPPENAVPQESSLNGQPLSVSSDQLTAAPLVPPELPGLSKSGTLSPPQTLSPQAMSQQLQQMYQQRMQILQQDRQATSSGGSGSH